MSKDPTRVRCSSCDHKFYVNSGGAKAFRFHCPKCNKALSIGRSSLSSSPTIQNVSTPPAVLPPRPPVRPQPPMQAPPAYHSPPNQPFPSHPTYSTGKKTRRKKVRTLRSQEKKPMPTWLKFFLIYLIGQIVLAPFVVIVVLLLFFMEMLGGELPEVETDQSAPVEYKTDFDALNRPLFPDAQK